MRLLTLFILLVEFMTIGSVFSAESVDQNILNQAPLAAFAHTSLIAVPDLKSIHDENNPDHEYHVTVGDYCSFLNAVASEGDPYGLYDERMASDPSAAYFTRVGDEGDYVYQPVQGCEALPMTYINRFAAARYCNWLANGQPHGPEGIETTEDGLDTLQGATTVEDLAHEVLGKYQYTLNGEGNPEYKDAEMGLRLYVLMPHDFNKRMFNKADKSVSRRALTSVQESKNVDKNQKKNTSSYFSGVSAKSILPEFLAPCSVGAYVTYKLFDFLYSSNI